MLIFIPFERLLKIVIHTIVSNCFIQVACLSEENVFKDKLKIDANQYQIVSR
jgi:hypothetical protein